MHVQNVLFMGHLAKLIKTSIRKFCALGKSSVETQKALRDLEHNLHEAALRENEKYQPLEKLYYFKMETRKVFKIKQHQKYINRQESELQTQENFILFDQFNKTS